MDKNKIIMFDNSKEAIRGVLDFIDNNCPDNIGCEAIGKQKNCEEISCVNCWGISLGVDFLTLDEK